MAPRQEKSVREYLNALLASPRFGAQVAHHEFLAAQAANYGELARPLAPEVARLVAEEAPRLYRHQTQAMDFISQGKDVMVATATASGKSLIYNTPIIETMLAAPASHALYLFPLKALAQDQLRRLQELAAALPGDQPFSSAVYDGDTNSYQRRKLRDSPPHIIITNPDMLHLSLLPYHGKWADYWAGLRYVVIDEVHTYRGVFGAHMAWVLRRLRRICDLYGSSPQFLLFSATIGNPAELAENLVGRAPEVITASGAPTASRHFVLFDPWDGAAWAASQLLEAALKRGLRAIVYSQSRKITELVALWTQQRLGPLQDKLAAYRAGFLPEERRHIETQLASGELLGVVSTSALELGIDIGSLDICILVGYPGSMMATWQRGGRVGRRQQESLVLMVAQEDALDQYFLHNPTDFFGREVESAVVNPANIEISKRHLSCAAAELPLTKAEVDRDKALAAIVAELVGSGQLLQDKAGSCYFSLRKQPQRQVDLRGGGGNFTIKQAATGVVLGEIDGGRCCKECHPGALYLQQGQTWEVVDLDLDDKLVQVRPKKANYFTRALARKDTEIIKIKRQVMVRNVKASLGMLKVTDQVTGFQRKLIKGQKTIGQESLELPPHIFTTEGLWLAIPPEIETQMRAQQGHFMGGIHAVEHVVISVLPLLVLCDRNDIGGISFPFHPQVQGAAIFIYDGYPGGVGLCAAALPRLEELLTRALAVIASCPCATGCPSCVHSPKCGSGNRPIDKEAARQVLVGLLAGAQPLTEMAVTAVTGVGDAAVEVEQEFCLPRRWAVFDVETQRSAAEVGGWHRAERMGISVAVVYDGETEEFKVFREGEISALIQYLAGRQLIVGFNNKRFDNRVLSGYAEHSLQQIPTVDLLEEVRASLGYRLSLDRLAQQTLGSKKSGDGILALQWYKEGRIDKIISYCQQDVEMTRDLFLYALQHKYLLFQNKAGQIVRCPLILTKRMIAHDGC